jgi:hypothetical protein
VFLIRTPALIDHAQDLPLPVDHFLEQMGRAEPIRNFVFALAAGVISDHPFSCVLVWRGALVREYVLCAHTSV